jgi:hypothetical protein
MAASVRQRDRRRWGGTVAAFAAFAAAVVVPAPPTTTAALAVGPTTAYVPVGPLRLADTRLAACGCVSLDGHTTRIDVTSSAAVPDDAVAAAITVTATPAVTPGFVTAYPGGGERPDTSTVNTRRDRVVANSTIIPIGADGTIEVYTLFTNELIVDVTGVFVPADRARAGRYRVVAPRRIVDTRPSRPLPVDGELTIPLPTGVDLDATAVAVNVTSLGELRPGHLRSRPVGAPDDATSFLNHNGSGQAVASTVILPVSRDGLTVTATGGGHVLVDLLGWFTGPGATESGDGLFVPVTPERLLDTRRTRPRLWPDGTIELANPAPAATALVTNLTLTFTDRRGYVTAYPAGTARPSTSTINPAAHDHTLANLAITRVSTRGVAYYGLAGTDVVVDLTGYFTGTPVAATRPSPPNQPDRARVLLVGDSTLASLDVYTASRSALLGFDPIVDAESCRRLLRPSCFSNTTFRTPNTAVEAILGTPGTLDVVVVKAGYNDWFSDFPGEFGAVVDAARAKGAHTILWLSYNQDVSRRNARRAYTENNQDLYWLVRLPRYSDVLLADWLAYSTPRPDWFADGTHLNREGSWALADYVNRWIAAIEHRPCPRPWVVGAPTLDPCPIPEKIGPVPDVLSLY